MKKLIGMAIILLLLAAAAVWQRKGQEARIRPPSLGDTTLLQGLDLNEITQIEVVKSSNHVALAKKDGQWIVESLYGCPADFGHLADALRKMANVKTGNPVRAGNVAVAEFGLDETAKNITLKTGDGKPAAVVTVGARRKASKSVGWAGQFFVRKAGSDNVYLVDYDFRPFSEKSDDWISKELLKVSSDDIVSVQEGDVAMKIDGADWTLTDLNKTTEELQKPEANKLRSALQYFNSTTVADPEKTDQRRIHLHREAGLKNGRRTVCAPVRKLYSSCAARRTC
jgi:hypothetical protein